MKLLNSISNQSLCLALMLFLTCFQSGIAQQATQYVYDDNGRLRAVISPNGEAGIYEYDPAGNITAIRRLAANTLEIIDFSARRGVPGNRVRIFGVGFEANVSAVTFNGTAATIISQSANQVIVAVPDNVSSGPIRLTTPRGTTTSTIPFTVAGVIVVPPTVSLLPGQVFQFAAQIPGTADQRVRWFVNDTSGGSSQIGTISESGFYEAPNLPASTVQVTVSAESLAQPGLRGESLVTITDNVFSTVSGAISVRYGNLPNTAAAFVASTDAISVRYGNPPNTTSAFAALTDAVSIRYGNPPSLASSYSLFADALSVRYGTSTNTSATPAIHSVSVTSGPAINAISPASLGRGNSATITITGVNLSGASALRFFNADNTAAVGLSATNINATTTSVTATLSATATASTGAKIIVLTTTAGRTQTANLGTNVITITQ